MALRMKPEVVTCVTKRATLRRIAGTIQEVGVGVGAEAVPEDVAVAEVEAHLPKARMTKIKTIECPW